MQYWTFSIDSSDEHTLTINVSTMSSEALSPKQMTWKIFHKRSATELTNVEGAEATVCNWLHNDAQNAVDVKNPTVSIDVQKLPVDK